MFNFHKLTLMPKWVFITVTVLLVSMLMTSPVLAFTEPTATSLSEITAIVRNVATWLLGLAGAFFVIMFILKGFKLATTAGNPRERADAIGGLLWTGVGAIVTFGAAFLVGIVMGIGQTPTRF